MDIIVEVDPCWKGMVCVEASRVGLEDVVYDVAIDARISGGGLVGLIQLNRRSALFIYRSQDET